ncbi:cation:proton antiporter [Thermococcus sp. M39]|uniref:Na+/H+ antiporter subunit E n=1 Tax=Thermococcus sp. M39 TaxID=1638262 RepID=UPI00143B5BB6|nr:Na+/H+ antiporter subunit E [Thermococcus sp. M39]NJE07657.1 cation:proton antiporter [Thermococcus sp. M39]
MKGFVSTVIIVLGTYLLYTGSATPYDILSGFIIGLIVTFIVKDWVIENDSKFLNPKRWFYMAIYSIKYFFITETLTHIDVAKRVFTLHTKPGIVRIPLNVKSDYGKILVANSITNTPGTVVVDIDEENNVLYVHWIDVSTFDEDEIKNAVVSYFEDYAKKIFD